jgi:tripartite-type tricarboxylate transporter receptor subunit TctC
VMADEGLQKVLIASGFEPILDSGPEATRAFIAAETARWVPVMKAANFKVE